eukprot:scpid72907/ scgid34253/ 
MHRSCMNHTSTTMGRQLIKSYLLTRTSRTDIMAIVFDELYSTRSSVTTVKRVDSGQYELQRLGLPVIIRVYLVLLTSSHAWRRQPGILQFNTFLKHNTAIIISMYTDCQ